MPAALGERPGRLHDPVREVDEVDVLEVEHGRAGVEAADLEQVGEQQLEPVELVLQQLGGPRGGRVEPVARVVQHVTGHPHRGQRGAQLVGDVGDEAALHPGELLELADLLLQAGGHLVEGRAQPGDVVVAAHVHALLEPAGREPLGDPPGQPHRGDDLPGDQPGDAADQEQQQRAAGDQGPPHQREGVLLLGHREEVVERVGAAVGRQRHLRAGDHAGHRRGVRCRRRSGWSSRCTTSCRRVPSSTSARSRSGMLSASTPGVLLVPAPAATPVAEPAIGPVQHDLVALHRAARHQRRDQLGELGAGVEVVAVGGREPASAPRRWPGWPRRPTSRSCCSPGRR